MARIGIIGVGLMGHGIGGNLLACGHDVTVLAHRNRAPVDDLVSRGAAEATSPKALAAAVDIVLVCVTGSPQLAAVADGPEGFVAGLSPGMTVIDCTTGEPDVVLAEAEAAAAAGARYADCPLARTPVEAEKGTLNVMVGAEPAVFEDIRPILECFCENIFHVGPIGSGTRMKLINNLITMGQAALIAEAVSACKASGVDLRVFYDIISKGGGNSGIFQMIVPDFIESGSCDGMKFSIANAAKDLGYFNRMADSALLAAPMGAAVHEQLDAAARLGFSDGLVGHLIAAALKLNRLEDGDREPRRAQTGA